jgi:hypothetical protein
MGRFFVDKCWKSASVSIIVSILRSRLHHFFVHHICLFVRRLLLIVPANQKQCKTTSNPTNLNEGKDASLLWSELAHSNTSVASWLFDHDRREGPFKDGPISKCCSLRNSGLVPTRACARITITDRNTQTRTHRNGVTEFNGADTTKNSFG